MLGSCTDRSRPTHTDFHQRHYGPTETDEQVRRQCSLSKFLATVNGMMPAVLQLTKNISIAADFPHWNLKTSVSVTGVLMYALTDVVRPFVLTQDKPPMLQATTAMKGAKRI